jgi:8-amino-3,8-dideoxy-alpha-D-manno-octulosonate transaminase
MSGAAARMDALAAIAQRRGLLLIEDVAQANGGSFHGRPLGSFGDAAVFSFQYNKTMTSGEGGLIAFSDKRRYQRAFATHDLGYVRNKAGRLDFDNDQIQLWGQGSRMSELCAAMALAQEEKLDAIVASMRAAARMLYAGLNGVAGCAVRALPDPDGDTGCFVILIWPDAATCAAMVEGSKARGVVDAYGSGNFRAVDFGVHLYYENRSLVNKRGTNKAGHPWTLPENAFAADLQYARGALPASDALFERASLIGLAPGMTAEDCAGIIAAFKNAAAALPQASRPEPALV